MRRSRPGARNGLPAQILLLVAATISTSCVLFDDYSSEADAGGALLGSGGSGGEEGAKKASTCRDFTAPEPRKSPEACAMCPRGFVCITARYTGYVYCVYPCTSDAQCACNDGSPHK